MAKGYRPVVRDQEFLLPPNMTEWLPEGHLAWFLIDTVAELDASVFHQRAARCRDGRERRNAAGRAAYDPVMLLTLLIYAYACGQRSSRMIERLCETDVGFRVICAQDAPDHTVISRFRQIHREAFTDLFAQVLRLCREAGMARLGTVAIDGSKIAANASRQANRGAEWLDAEIARTEAELARQGTARQGTARQGTARQDTAGQAAADRETVARILAEAEQVDAAEDAEYGPDARGDELPAGWRRRGERLERLRAARARLQAIEDAERAEAERLARKRAEQDQAELATAEAALAAEIAAREAARDAWEQAWEQAAMANQGAPLPRGAAPKPPEQAAAVRRARARAEKARARVEHPDTAPRRGRRRNPDKQRAPGKPKVNITDPDSSIMPTKTGGWEQDYNTQFAVSADHCITAVDVSTNPADIVSYQPMVTKTEQVAADLDALDELGTLLLDNGYCSDDTLTAPGPDRLIATGTTRSVRQAARDNPTAGPPPPDASPREAMDHRLRTPEGAALYTRRAATVEPVIGTFKTILDRFSIRGLAAATAEAHLAAAVFNLRKLHRTTQTATA